MAVFSGACGRLGYDPISMPDAGGGAAGRGGSLGTAGSAGTGGIATGAGGAVGTGGGAAGSSAGAAGTGGGAAGSGGSAAGSGGSATGSGGSAAGSGGAAGGAAGTTGGAGAPGADGGTISCYTATYGTHDYLFCDALVDWATARAECEGRAMRLVRIDDAGENTWLQATAQFASSMARREILWLGGYEPTTDGDWRWTDGAAFWLGGSTGTAVGGLYTTWDGNEPNNAVGAEACLAIQLNKTTWYDWGCATGGYFACERY